MKYWPRRCEGELVELGNSDTYDMTNPEGPKRWLEIHNNSQQQGAKAQPQRTTITFDKLATIRVPTLLMPGDQDPKPSTAMCEH